MNNVKQVNINSCHFQRSSRLHRGWNLVSCVCPAGGTIGLRNSLWFCQDRIVCAGRISHLERDTCPAGLAGGLVSQTASLSGSSSRPAVLLLASAPVLEALTLKILFLGRCEAVLTHQNEKWKEPTTEIKHRCTKPDAIAGREQQGVGVV